MIARHCWLVSRAAGRPRRAVAGKRANYAAPIDAVFSYARPENAFCGLPGMTFAMTGADGFGSVLTLDHPDVEAGAPVTLATPVPNWLDQQILYGHHPAWLHG